MPSSWHNAAATMVGQALGANKPDRAERAVWIAGFYNMIFLGITGVIYWVAAPTIVTFFASNGDPERAAEVALVIAWGIQCLRIVSLGFVFFAYGMVLTQSFNGAGDAWTPTLINLFVFWAFELPFAAVLSYWAGWGPTGVFVAMTASFSLLAVVSAVVFRRGTWKETVV